jgi:hypothetical protein
MAPTLASEIRRPKLSARDEPAELLNRHERARLVDHAMAVRAQDREVGQSRRRPTTECSQRQPMMALGESRSQATVSSFEIKSTRLALEAAGCLEHGRFLRC